MSYSFSMNSQTKTLLIGIDGLMLQRAIDSGRAPTLTNLRSDSYFSEMTVEMPTVSGPSWTTLLTGTTQQVHKVVDNDFNENNLAEAPDLLTQASKIIQGIRTYAAAGWPPLIDPADIGPVIRTRNEDQELGNHFIFVRDGETHGYKTVDVEVANDAIRQIRDIAPDLSFVYFCGADEAGHLHGTISGPYFDAIERIDSLISQFHQVTLTRYKSYGEKWLIVITTDHGHRDEGGHGGDSEQERASFVIAHGIGQPHPAWPAQIKPEELVSKILSTL
jgi:predicted AlkP superfamily pyrophosphatase or phosphodiesterase